MTFSIRKQLDWGRLGSLRLQARQRSDGVRAGHHKSYQHGSGVEFGGHRDYLPGDDLRWLDRHALMRHGRPMIRQFETDTDRSLFLVLDASASMRFQSGGAKHSKLEFASLVGAALAKVAVDGGDPVALEWLGGDGAPLAPASSRNSFDRIVADMERVSPGGTPALEQIVQLVARVRARARPGAVLVLLTDLLDFPDAGRESLGALIARGEQLLVVRVLDPVEATFPFEGVVRLRGTEDESLVETDGPTAREGYLKNLEAQARTWQDWLTTRRGRLLYATSSDDPIEVARAVFLAARGRSA